jgi:YVTN family beta-propeller protein/autotransporter-associated beta strand protein
MKILKDWLFLRRQDTTLQLVNLFLCALTAHAQNGPFLYVPTNLQPGVSVVDTSTNSVPFAAIPAGPGIAVAVMGDESAVYVPNDINGTVTPVNTAANTLGTPIQLTGGPFVEGLAITPNGKTVYAATVSVEGFPGATGFLTPINTATNTAGTPIDVGLNPRGVVASPDGKTIYVANLIVSSLGEGTVTPVNTATNTAGTPIPVGPVGSGIQAFSLAITPDGKTLYVGNPFGSASGTPSLIAINTATKVATPIPGVAASFGLAVSPNGRTLYVANAFADTVTVINTATNAVITTIPVSGTPNGVAVSPDGRTVYVTNFGTDTVTPINTATNKAGAPIPVVMAPEIFPGIASNGNALLASGLTFVAHTSGALESTLASGPTGSPGPIFTGGTLQFAGPNITSALPIIIQAEGGTIDTLSNSATLSGTISGPGALTKIGTGTLTLLGDNTYTGGTTINGGTLQLGNGGTTGSITGNVIDNGTLAFDRSDVFTFTGVISGTGAVQQIGTGTTVLTGTNTYTGMTTVDSGSLIVNGSIASTETLVGSAGFLGGTGLIGGNLVNNGIVSPGSPVGTLTVSGSYTQSPSGTLRIQVSGLAPGQFGLLAVGGHASLAGTLQLVALNGFKLQVGNTITFLTAGAGVSGNFSTIQNPFISDTIVKAQVIELADAVEIQAVQGNFVDAACDPNSAAVARALNSAVGDPRASALIAFLDNQPIQNLCADFTLISPEQMTSMYNMGISLAGVQMSNLMQRMDSIHLGSSGFSSAGFTINGNPPSFIDGLSGPTGAEGKAGPSALAPIPENRWGVFVTGLGEFTSIDGTFGAPGFDLQTGGVTVGADYRIGSNFAIGLMGGYAHLNADLISNGDIGVNSGKFGAYATAFGNGFYLDTAVTGSIDGYDTHRAALLGFANGSTDGSEVTFLIAGGYDWKKGNLSIGPTANFQYTHVKLDGFTESGSLAPLTYPDQSTDSWTTAFGAKAYYDWHVGHVLVRPEISVAWQHEYGDQAYSIIAGFANGAGTSFTVTGPQIGRDSLLLDAGVSVLWSDRISTYVYYDGDLARTNYQSNSVTGGIRITF